MVYFFIIFSEVSLFSTKRVTQCIISSNCFLVFNSPFIISAMIPFVAEKFLSGFSFNSNKSTILKIKHEAFHFKYLNKKSDEAHCTDIT